MTVLLDVTDNCFEYWLTIYWCNLKLCFSTPGPFAIPSIAWRNCLFHLALLLMWLKPRISKSKQWCLNLIWDLLILMCTLSSYGEKVSFGSSWWITRIPLQPPSLICQITGIEGSSHFTFELFSIIPILTFFSWSKRNMTHTILKYLVISCNIIYNLNIFKVIVLIVFEKERPILDGSLLAFVRSNCPNFLWNCSRVNFSLCFSIIILWSLNPPWVITQVLKIIWGSPGGKSQTSSMPFLTTPETDSLKV